MSKNLQGDTKGEGVVVGDGELHTIPSHMITSQASAAAPGLPLTRPALALQTPAQHTYIVQPHHEMKNYGKSTRPIAPAPPSQAFQNLTPRSAPQTNNIPSIIAPSVGSGGNSEPASAMGTVGHSSISVPVTLSQASVLTLTNPSSLGNTATIVQQGLQGSAIPINMLRGPVAQPQPQIQALQNLSHITRGAPTLSVPKSPALLRQTSPAAATTLQIPGGLPHTLSLPMARAPLLQTIKTTTAQVARPLSPAVGAQAQDLSRANFPLHGSITPASQGPMHITLNRVAAPSVAANMNQVDNSPTTGGLSGTAAAIPGRSVAVSAVTAGGLSSSTTSQNSDLQQPRMNVSVNQDTAANSGGVHHHIHHPLNNPHHHQHQIGRSSTLPFSGPPSSLSSMSSNKLPHPGLVQPAKVIPSHALQQQGAPPSIKSVNLPVPNPVMMNSINPGTIPVCIASSPAPIPIAKVTPQRQHVAGSIPLVSASVHSHIVSSAAAASSATSVASSVSTLPTAMAISSLPTSLPLSLSSSSFSPAGATLVESTTGRQELAGLSVSQSSNGGIIITPDFQARSSGTIIPMTSLTTSGHGNTAPTAVSHTDNRPGGLTQPHQQQIGIGPDDPMWYQHIVYQHVSQSPLVSQPGAPTIVRPGPNAFALLPAHGKVQVQNSTLTALPVSSATPNLRFSAAAAGGTMMMVDPHRQQHHPQGAVLHPALSGASIPGNLVAEKLTNLSRQSAASGNVYTASVGVQSHMAGSGGGMGTGQSGGLSAVPVSNPSSSPRPSILRKRTSEPAGVVIRKPNFNLNQDHRCHSPPRVDTTSTTISSNTTSGSSPTPKISTKNYSPMSENSQSSTDTALSSNDATTPTNNHNDKAKGEGEEGMENGPSQTSHVNNIPASPAVSHTGSLSEASPRKRARKQSLHANEELKDNSSSEDEVETSLMKKRDDVSKEQRLREKEIERRGEYTDEDGVRWILHKPKPTFVLLQPDVINNKTRNNHFVKYGDVKPKEERRPTVNELSNQKGIMQKVNGWKLYFSASQLEELEDFEKEMQSHFLDVQKDLAKIASYKTGSDDSLKIHEISQANIQRCELIQSQLSEARGAMLRTLEHQPRIHQIVNKHMSKRPIKKKERT